MQIGFVTTSTSSRKSLQEAATALAPLRAAGHHVVIKHVAGWGPIHDGDDGARAEILDLGDAVLIRTLHGDPSVEHGAHEFLHPEHVIARVAPLWRLRNPRKPFLIELGNEPLIAPDPDDWRACIYGHYLDLAITACRKEFPEALLIAPAHMVNHAVAVGDHEWGQERYLELHAPLYRRCDFVGIHAYTVEQFDRAAGFVRKHVGAGADVLYLTEFALNEPLDDATRGRRYAELLRGLDVVGACLYHLDELGGQDPAHFNPHYRLNVSTLEALARAWNAPMTPAIPPRPPVTNVAMSREHLSRGRAHGPVRLLVMHATAGRAPGDFNWLKQGGSMISPVSCHYYIDKAGRISQFVADHDTAWHAGESRWHGLEIWSTTKAGRRVPSLNAVSIGIELENRNNGADPYPEAQIAAAVALARHLVAAHRIARLDLVRHLDISPGRKTDPAGFPWASFVERVYAK